MGRTRDIAAVHEWASRQGTRVLHLWGPAGVGKSALALAAFPDAIVCSLAGEDDIDGICWALSHALELPPDTGDLAIAALVGQAVAHLDRPLLLDDADDALTVLPDLLARWSSADDGSAVVVTSRRVAEIDGASQQVEPLSPDDGVRLWLDLTGARGTGPEREAAREIVDRLDGLPLALEWFAGKALLLGSDVARARLSSFAEGADPLTGALRESLADATPEQRRTLEAVCAFDGGAPSELLAAWGVDTDRVDELAGASWVRLEGGARGGRVRAFRSVVKLVREQARNDGSWDAIVDRHAALVLDAADARAATELPSMRSELEAVARRRPDLALRARLALCPLALRDGTAENMERALTKAEQTDTLPARAHLWLGRLQRRGARFEEARVSLRTALDSQDDSATFEAMLELAHIDRQKSRSDEALAGYEAALEHARASGDVHAHAVALGEMGRMLQSVGRFRDAQRHHEDAIVFARTHEFVEREALERSLHARAIHRAGRIAEAIPLHEQALSLHREHGLWRLAAAEEGHLGYCLHEIERHDEAEQRFRSSIAGLAKVGDVVLENIERLLLARLLSDVGRHGEARLELAITRRALTSIRVPRLAFTLGFVEGLAHLARGDEASTRESWTAALALGVIPEVGFEALLPAWFAWLCRHDDRSASQRAFEEAERLFVRMDSPAGRAALALLRKAADDEPLAVDPELRGSSSDVRRVLRLVRGVAPAIVVGRDGQRLTLADGTEVDLRRRAAPRRLLVALAEARIASPGRVLSFDELIAAGWPGEKMLVEAARKRLRTAIWTIRKMGLDENIHTRDDGYLLDASVAIEWSR